MRTVDELVAVVSHPDFLPPLRITEDELQMLVQQNFKMRGGALAQGRKKWVDLEEPEFYGIPVNVIPRDTSDDHIENEKG